MTTYLLCATVFITAGIAQLTIQEIEKEHEKKIKQAQVHLKDLDSNCHEVDEDKQKKCIESIEALKEILKKRTK